MVRKIPVMERKSTGTAARSESEAATLARDFLALARECVDKARNPEDAETAEGAFHGATARSYAQAGLSAVQGYATVVKLAAETSRRRS